MKKQKNIKRMGKTNEHLPAKVAVNPETGLTAKQEQCAALLATGTNITEAAAAMKVDRGTIYIWMKKVTFSCYLNRLAADNLMEFKGRLSSMQCKALDIVQGVLEGTLNAEADGLRLNTAKWLLEKFGHSAEGETDAREVLRKECTRPAWGGSIDEPIFREEEYMERLREEGLGASAEEG